MGTFAAATATIRGRGLDVLDCCSIVVVVLSGTFAVLILWNSRLNVYTAWKTQK